jgi:crossover junction endonuclease MUS81
MNPKLILEIDYRERKIIDFFKSEQKDDINYNICNLEIGDFVFKENDDIIHYIIERKTVSDLAASIIDGRFREQKQRLLDCVGTNDKIIYIIEDDTTQKKICNLSKTIIDSSILNLIFKHKYKVIHTTSEKDKYFIFISIYKKLKFN